MNTSQHYSPYKRALPSPYLDMLQKALIEPARAIDDIVVHRTARLLATFLLFLTVVFLAIDLTHTLIIPGYRATWYGYLLLGSAYILSRTRYYTLAAALTAAMFPIVVFVGLIYTTIPGPLALLNYLVVGLLVGSIFLSAGGLT